jgi:hypothetical protein
MGVEGKKKGPKEGEGCVVAFGGMGAPVFNKVPQFTFHSVTNRQMKVYLTILNSLIQDITENSLKQVICQQLEISKLTIKL